MFKLSLYLLYASLLLLSQGCGKKQSDELSPTPKRDKILFKLHWIPDSHQAGFWVALEKGFFDNQNLDVKIFPGGLDANPLRDVLNGAADIGQVGGIEQVVLARSEGLPVKAIATLHRKSPHALISLSNNPISTSSDIANKTIAVAFGDTAEILLKAFMDAQGIPLSSVKFVPYRYDLTPLFLGQVDAVTGFSTGQPVTVIENGKTPVVLTYDSAVSSYGYTLTTSENLIKDKESAIKRFLQASRQGWDFTFKNIDEAAELLHRRFGNGMPVKRTKEELLLIKTLMLTQEGELDKWSTDFEKVNGVIKMLHKFGNIKNEVNPASLISNSLLDE